MIDATPEHESGPEPTRDGGLGLDSFLALTLLEASLAPLALGLGWLLGTPPLARFAWSGRAAAMGVVAAVPMLVLLALSLRWPIGPLRRIRRFFDAEVRPVLGDRGPGDLALISLAAGVGEELLFRGVIQAALSRWLGTWAGLGVASLLFGLVHSITPAYAVIAALLGIYLGGVWMVSGNLLTVIVAHALYDFIALRLLLATPPPESSASA